MAGLKIKKGDTVQVLSGKDRGKQGRVVRTFPEDNKVMVEGVNQVKRHEPIRQGRGRTATEGGIITKEMPVHASSVAVVCGSCGKPTRIGYEIEGASKTRICRKCGGKV